MKNFDPLLTTAFSGNIGVAREDITPPIGIYSRLWGSALHDVAEGIHRPLTLTALALSDANGIPLILIAMDSVCCTNPKDEWGIRGALLAALGLDPARVLFAHSHTHAAPNLLGENGDKPGGALIAPYLDSLRDASIRAATRALGSSRPARLSWRYGRCDLATNRDLPSSDGKRFLVGCNPDEPADDTLLVGRVEDAGSGEVVAVVVNYACHPTSLAGENRLISPDYIGGMREIVESAAGAPCLFLQGASGELAPAEDKAGDTAVADRNGRRLGYAVMAVLEGWRDACLKLDAVVESGAPLAVFRNGPTGLSTELRASLNTIDLPLKPMPPLAKIEEDWRNCTDRAMRERLWRKRNLRLRVGDGDTMANPIWAWRIGEALLVAQPDEAYSDYQRELRSRFNPRAVAVLNLVNGGCGYLPPQAHYSRDQYSVWQTPFAKGSLEWVTAKTAAFADSLLAGSDARR